MAYVAPTWRNGGPPALDAAALQAISDAIVGAETKNASQDSLIAALQTAVSALQSGGAKIEVGSYVGTGTYGASNPNSITCSFVPKVVWLYKYIVKDNKAIRMSPIYGNSSNQIVEFNDLSSSYTQYDGFSYSSAGVSSSYGKKSGNTLSWYCTSGAIDQCNDSRYIYYWVAFG